MTCQTSTSIFFISDIFATISHQHHQSSTFPQTTQQETLPTRRARVPCSQKSCLELFHVRVKLSEYASSVSYETQEFADDSHPRLALQLVPFNEKHIESSHQTIHHQQSRIEDIDDKSAIMASLLFSRVSTATTGNFMKFYNMQSFFNNQTKHQTEANHIPERLTTTTASFTKYHGMQTFFKRQMLHQTEANQRPKQRATKFTLSSNENKDETSKGSEDDRIDAPDVGGLLEKSLASTTSSAKNQMEIRIDDYDVGGSFLDSLKSTTSSGFLSNQCFSDTDYEPLKSLAHFQLGALDVGGSLVASLALTKRFEFLSDRASSDAVGLQETVEKHESPIPAEVVKTSCQGTGRRGTVSSSLLNQYQPFWNVPGDNEDVGSSAWECELEERASSAHAKTTILEQGCAPKLSEQKESAKELGHASGRCDGSAELSKTDLRKESSIEHSSAGGGSSEKPDMNRPSGLDTCRQGVSSPVRACNVAHEQPIKRSRFAEFFKGMNLNRKSPMDMTEGKTSIGAPILQQASRHGSISDRGVQYDDVESCAAARTMTFEECLSQDRSKTEQGHDSNDRPQDGNVFVPQSQNVGSATLQLALEWMQAREDQALAHNFRDSNHKSDCDLKQRRLRDELADTSLRTHRDEVVRQCFEYAGGQEKDNESPRACAIVDELVDGRDLDSPGSRIRDLEAALLQGQRLERISGSEAFSLFKRFPERVRMQVQTPPPNQEMWSDACSEEPQTVIHLSNSNAHTDVLDQKGEARVDWRDRVCEYDAPWLVGDRTNLSEISPVSFSLQPLTNSATPTVSENGSDTDYETLDDSIRYSPSIKEYRKAQLHHDNLAENSQPSKTLISQPNKSSNGLPSLNEIMKHRTSRQERMSRSQLETQTYTSIFELAKTAQARVRGMEDPFIVSKKQRQYVDIVPIEEYEPSSPSDSSDAEGWMSDLTDDVKDAQEEECKRIAAHRAEALAKLEGRAAPAEDLQPIFRSARMEYEDHVEAEHGMLHTYAPKPIRPATQMQRAIQDWDQQIIANNFQSVDDRFIGLGITIPQDDGLNDVIDWLNSDSPVDLINGRPVFYYQPSQQADEFWDEMSLEQLNAENALPPNVVNAQVARRVERSEWNVAGA